MKTTSISKLRRNLAATIDAVASDHEPVLITRSGGKALVVLISLENFTSFEETSYLLCSPGNAGRLRTAVAELDAGEGEVKGE
ncbi:MAG: type II toxin-antitoxin system prevent-host-death family antitoxin [Gammaproteobacteria bacterium]|nr:type II toxin-antitoxin system prevent-host-death family antitoxin [Gammaproteobacteria bacterium]MYH86025.1 type II toxin-antitoxin system prevent-host-death family antitoxin [Gammaproteobacteria bacterium]MYK04116.1 type II toxin-antitoxin system prevent-host-death family antitoxin [Gammaproteobacteria bacterium]